MLPPIFKHRSVLLIILSVYAIATTCALLYISALTFFYGSVTIIEPNRAFLVSETLLLLFCLAGLIASLFYNFLHRSPP